MVSQTISGPLHTKLPVIIKLLEGCKDFRFKTTEKDLAYNRIRISEATLTYAQKKERFQILLVVTLKVQMFSKKAADMSHNNETTLKTEFAKREYKCYATQQQLQEILAIC